MESAEVIIQAHEKDGGILSLIRRNLRKGIQPTNYQITLYIIIILPTYKSVTQPRKCDMNQTPVINAWAIALYIIFTLAFTILWLAKHIPSLFPGECYLFTSSAPISKAYTVGNLSTEVRIVRSKQSRRSIKKDVSVTHSVLIFPHCLLDFSSTLLPLENIFM